VDAFNAMNAARGEFEDAVEAYDLCMAAGAYCYSVETTMLEAEADYEAADDYDEAVREADEAEQARQNAFKAMNDALKAYDACRKLQPPTLASPC
jgi:hypothetical protein